MYSPKRPTYTCKNRPQSSVSIILPLYNGKPFISLTIDSILSQSFTNFELLIIDDGSTDGCGKIVKSIRDPRIKYIRCTTNGGVSKARNIGLKLAKSPYISYCDYDDIWYKDYLKKMVAILDRYPKIAFVFARFRSTGIHKPAYIPRSYPPYAFSQERLENQNIICPSSIVHRKICTNSVGGFDTSTLLNRYCYEDWDLWLRISDRFKIHYLRTTLGEYIFHGKNHSMLVSVFTPYIHVIKKRIKKYKSLKKLNYYAVCVIFKLSVITVHENMKVWQEMSKRFLNFKKHKWKSLLRQYCDGIDLYVRADFLKAKSVFKKSQRYFVNNSRLNKHIVKEATLALTFFLGKCESKSGNFKTALQLHKKNLRIDKDYLPSLEQVTLINFELEKYADAWRSASKLNPAFIYNLKGVYFVKKRQYKKAISFFNKVLIAKPNFRPAKKNLEFVKQTFSNL